MALKYRPDIDGLRTVAVLSVVLYHFGVPGFSGGYVGVDVFFVISGFLITRIIVNEVAETGSLSFARFYTRRARRLFPAMIVTVGVSFAASFLLFSPAQMEGFAQSAIFAVISLSNILFWWQSGYFDAEAYTKPLLHTWSLSVEEQFYLLWPGILSFFLVRYGQKVTAAFVLAVSALSLIGAEYLISLDASAAFFLLPARIVELGIGAAMVWGGTHGPASPRLLDALLIVGLGMIAAAVFFYTPETAFPGTSSLLPCVGAAIALYAGAAPRAGILLNNRVSVSLGKWSYSIYLVHWPLYVFFVAYVYRSPTGLEVVLLVAITILLGWLQYLFIEERFRHERAVGAWSRPAFGLGCALLALAAVVPSSMTWASNGAAWRTPEYRLQKTNVDWRREERAKYCQKRNRSLDQEIFTCQNWRGKEKTIVIWGDSHALHLVAGFSKHFPDHNILVSYMSGCVPQSGFDGYVREMGSDEDRQRCIDRNKATLEYLVRGNVDMTIVTSAKRSAPEEVAGPINTIMAQLLDTHGLSAVYLADFIRPGRELIDCVQVPKYVISDEYIAKRCVGDKTDQQNEYRYNEQMEHLIRGFVQVNHVQCPNGECRFFDGVTPLFRDTHHLSIPGSIDFVAELKKRGALP